MTELRPHRAALTAAVAAGRLRHEVVSGRFDPDAIEAVLALPVTASGAAARVRRA